MQSSSLDHKTKTPAGFIHFGSISGVFGVHGEVKFFLHNLDSALLNQWVTVRLWSGGEPEATIEMNARRGSGKRVVGKLRIDGRVVSSPEEARSFMQRELLIAETALPTLEDEEFYHHQLLGLPVLDEQGQAVGQVVEITPGTVDVLTIQAPDRTLMYVPFISARVLHVTSDSIVIRQADESSP